VWTAEACETQLCQDLRETALADLELELRFSDEFVDELRRLRMHVPLSKGNTIPGYERAHALSARYTAVPLAPLYELVQ
jgi:hypothetical protein